MLGAIKNILKQKQPVRPGVSPEEVRAMAAEAARRAQQRIGGGQFGQVYEASPGFVVKEITLENKQNLLNEINTQARAAELGLAPKIQSASLNLPKIGDRVIPLEPGPNPKMRGDIVMQDLRENYDQAEVFTNQQQLDQAKQMARLSLNNIGLGDRHSGNIMFNRTTGRPIQLDFGLSETITSNTQKAANLSLAVTQGLKAAGLMDEATILQGVVADLLQKDPEMALDVAKQGLSRLQKIKTPVNPQEYVYIDTGNDVPF
jgi:tRNA A-37 threonylcarbamoyl transferase component Bud32